MLPVLSSTTPISWQTSSVFQPGIRAWPPSPGQHLGQTKRHHLDPRAGSVESDGQRPNPATLTNILSSLRALAGGQYQSQRVPALIAARTPPQTPHGRTRTRPPRTRSETGHALRSPLPCGPRRSHSTFTGRPVRAVAPAASDVAKITHHWRAKGEAGRRGRAPGRARTRSECRRTQSGGQLC